LRLSVRVTIVKLGCIASTALIESLLDERASREDIVVRSFSSGSKMDAQSAKDLVDIAVSVKSDLFLVVSPNVALEVPRSLAKRLSKKAPTTVISDAPAKRALEESRRA